MDPQVGASFIPKKPFVGGTSSGRGGGIGLLFLLVLFLFICSIAAAGAAFLYNQYLTRAIASKAHSLELAQAAYDPSAIADLIRLDSRINEAQKVIQKHIAPSSIFLFLSAQTLEKVRFNSFTYTNKDEGMASMTLEGQTDSFSTIALQSDQLGASKVLKDIIFSNIAVDSTTGRVTFTVNAKIDPSLILYSNALASNPPIPEVPIEPTAPTI